MGDAAFMQEAIELARADVGRGGRAFGACRSGTAT